MGCPTWVSSFLQLVHHLRARIAGAKKDCEAKGATHCRCFCRAAMLKVDVMIYFFIGWTDRISTAQNSLHEPMN